MKRTILAAALASGALAVPAYALASGGDGSTDPQVPSNVPVQQEQQPDQQQPRGHDCPEGQGNGTAPEAPESGSGGGSSDTLL